MLPKSDGLARLRAVIDKTPRGRSELLELSGLSIESWRPAIMYLLENGLVQQLGTKRGAQYVIASDSIGIMQDSRSSSTSLGVEWQGEGPKGTYHDLIEEVLRELGGDDEPAGMTDAPKPNAAVAVDGEGATDSDTVEKVRTQLIRFREQTLQPDLRPDGRSAGLLRKTMIDALLRERPRDRSQFLHRIPRHLLEATNRVEIDAYLPEVLEILRQLETDDAVSHESKVR